MKAPKIIKTLQSAWLEAGPYVAPLALVAWACAFSVEVFVLSRAASVLSANCDRLEESARRLKLGSGSVVSTVRETRALSKELEFLQDLPNMLPQEKGYLRTQKVIAEEVQKARGRIAQRLKGVIHVIVDAKANKLYVKKGLSIVWQADCSVGRGGMLVDKKTGRRWEFVTPRGEFRVLAKGENPVWLKPDWAFVEFGEPIPPPEDPRRKVEGELGAFVLSLGDGYLIHGTKNEALLGRPASHGCVRLGVEDLKRLYETVPVGTRVYIVY